LGCCLLKFRDHIAVNIEGDYNARVTETFLADFEAEVERIANLRVKEAFEIGAEIIVTACLWCLINVVSHFFYA